MASFWGEKENTRLSIQHSDYWSGGLDSVSAVQDCWVGPGIHQIFWAIEDEKELNSVLFYFRGSKDDHWFPRVRQEGGMSRQSSEEF